ncbi:hypothetical protein, partial [Leptospira ellisii]|uniref:hypothetical protein n=1 Tax=Leptospira ellisii TaxID=2023197 RepID=UPI001A9D7966
HKIIDLLSGLKQTTRSDNQSEKIGRNLQFDQTAQKREFRYGNADLRDIVDHEREPYDREIPDRFLRSSQPKIGANKKF